MVTAGPDEQLVSEPITPARGSFDTAAMARGEPGLPARFTWRDVAYVVTDVIEQWKSSEAEGGSGELYLRRHWFKVRVTAVLGAAEGPKQAAIGPASRVMTLYCLRQPPRGRTGSAARRRWWLYSVQPK